MSAASVVSSSAADDVEVGFVVDKKDLFFQIKLVQGSFLAINMMTNDKDDNNFVLYLIVRNDKQLL